MNWKSFGDIAVRELEKGKTDYAKLLIPEMANKLQELQQYADQEGKLQVMKTDTGVTGREALNR